MVPGTADMTGLFGGITFDSATSTYVFLQVVKYGQVWRT